jgi:hypothetical protein
VTPHCLGCRSELNPQRHVSAFGCARSEPCSMMCTCGDQVGQGRPPLPRSCSWARPAVAVVRHRRHPTTSSVMLGSSSKPTFSPEALARPLRVSLRSSSTSRAWLALTATLVSTSGSTTLQMQAPRRSPQHCLHYLRIPQWLASRKCDRAISLRRLATTVTATDPRADAQMMRHRAFRSVAAAQDSDTQDYAGRRSRVILVGDVGSVASG